MYPLALSLRGRRVTIAGGGAAAERTVHGLLEAGAAVVLIAAQVTPALAALAQAGRIRWERRAYRSGDFADSVLAFAASADEHADAAAVADARAAGILVGDASDPSRGDFTTPALHRAGPLTVTIDGGALASSFTKRVRDELALQFDARYGRAAATLAALRDRIAAVVPAARRAAVMQHFGERDLEELAAMLPGSVEHEVERAAESLAGVVPSQTRALVCATRKSALAMTQTRTMVARLAVAGIPSTLLEISTRGDLVVDRSIAAIGTDNVFVTELELALRTGRADYAVHSCKDLPSTLAPDMELAAITAREDPRDAFCSERWPSFEALPAGARVGTSSPRRRAQLRALRPDLVYDDIRGNVDTRLRKLREGAYDAIVLACAGLHRLGLRATHTVPLEAGVVTPMVGQGALAIETRAGDPLAARLAGVLADPATSLAVRAERAFLRTLRGGCQAPVGAHARWAQGRFSMTAVVAAADGSRVLRDAREAALGIDDVPGAEALGITLARELLDAGGSELLGAARGPLSGRLVLLARAGGEPSRIAPALRDAGAEVVEAGDSAAAGRGLAGRVPGAILFPSSGAVDAVGEYLELLRRAGHRPPVAAMSSASSQTAAARGWPADIVAPSAEDGAFVQTVTRFLLETGA